MLIVSQPRMLRVSTTIMALLAVLSLLGCSSEPLEESVSHPSSLPVKQSETLD